MEGSWDSSVGIVTSLQADARGTVFDSRQGQKFYFSPQLTGISGYWGIFNWECSGRDMKQANHFRLMLRLRVSGAVPPAHIFSWRGG